MADGVLGCDDDVRAPDLVGFDVLLRQLIAPGGPLAVLNTAGQLDQRDVATCTERNRERGGGTAIS